jgi:hypothetical protein
MAGGDEMTVFPAEAKAATGGGACRWLLLGVFGVVSVLSSPAMAQRSPGDWDRPVAVTVELEVLRQGERRPQELRRDEIALPAGSSVELLATARDQRGRAFPPERMAWGMDVGRECDGRVTVEELQPGRLRLRASAQRGRCDLVLWVPGNLNLDRRLGIEVGPRFDQGYDRREAELVAATLFRGILGREPDPEGLRHAVAEIQRGRLESQVRSMCASPEYRAQRQRLPAHQLLDELYQGLLERPSDSSGVRTYLRDVERGRCAEVTLALVRSEEYEAKLVGAPQPPPRRRR